MAPMRYPTYHTIFKTHSQHGVCGKCSRSFPTSVSRGEYFCEPCRDLPLETWKKWMDGLNALAEAERKEMKGGTANG